MNKTSLLLLLFFWTAAAVFAMSILLRNIPTGAPWRIAAGVFSFFIACWFIFILGRELRRMRDR